MHCRNGGDESSSVGMSNTSLLVNNGDVKVETPNVKKRHRRMKSSNIKNQECEGKLAMRIDIKVEILMYKEGTSIILD